MAGYNFAQNIIGLNKVKGDIHDIELSISQLSASTLPYNSEETIEEAIKSVEEGTCTFPEGVTNLGTNIKKTKNNNVCLSSTVQKTLTLSTWNELINLPNGFHDSNVKRCIAFNTTKGYPVEAEITNEGIFRIYPTPHDSEAAVQNITILISFILS